MNAQERLAELSYGYQHSVILLTACHVGVFGALGKEALEADELAQRLNLDARALETLLLALCADEVLARDGDGFRIAEPLIPLLLPDEPTTQANILSHHYNCLLRWVGLEKTLRTGQPPVRESGVVGKNEMRQFILGMENISRASSLEVAEKFGLSDYRRMLDVGGGPGTSSIVFAQRFPDLRCVVFDLESPIGIAKEQIAKAGVGDRVTTRVGDYFRDGLGEGFDLVYISNIIHSLGPEDVAMIARKSFEALEPGATIIVKDFLLEDSRTAPAFAALFSINMLVGTKEGKSYTLTETRDILAQAGFGDFRDIEVAAASRLLVGRKPS